MVDVEKRLLAASPLKPFVWKMFIFSLWKIPMEEVPFLLTSLTRSTLRSILLVKCHPKALFFSIQMYSKDFAFQLLEFSIHKPISSPLKLFSIHTSYPVNHSLRKRVLWGDASDQNWKYRFTQRDLSAVSNGVISCHIKRWSAVSSLPRRHLEYVATYLPHIKTFCHATSLGCK